MLRRVRGSSGAAQRAVNSSGERPRATLTEPFVVVDGGAPLTSIIKESGLNRCLRLGLTPASDTSRLLFLGGFTLFLFKDDRCVRDANPAGGGHPGRLSGLPEPRKGQ